MRRLYRGNLTFPTAAHHRGRAARGRRGFEPRFFRYRLVGARLPTLLATTYTTDDPSTLFRRIPLVDRLTIF